MRTLTTLIAPERIDALLETIRGSHRVEVRVMVADMPTTQWLHTYSTEMGGDPVSNAAWHKPTWEVIEGSVTENRQDVHRQLRLKVASEYWDTPFDAIADLSPYTKILSIERGVRVAPPIGVVWVPMGVYRITDLNTTGSGSGDFGIDITAYSLEADVREARFPQLPVAGVSVGTLASDILVQVLRAAFPAGATLPITWPPGRFVATFTAGGTLATDRDRLKFVKDLEHSTASWGRFTRMNDYRVDVEPDVTEPAVWTVDAGPQGVLVSYSKGYTRNGIYNGVYGTGENRDAGLVYYAFAGDFDPLSPTRWGGPFGYVPRFWSSPLIRSQAQLDQGVQTLLAGALSNSASVSFDFVPNPLLEVGDVVDVLYYAPPRRTTVRTERHLIESLEIGLGPDAVMKATTQADVTSLAEVGEM